MRLLRYIAAAAVAVCFFTVAAAVYAADISETAILADFSSDSVYEDPELVGIVKSSGAGLSAEQSGEFDLGGGAAEFKVSVDFTDYTAVNLWVYNAEYVPENYFDIVFYTGTSKSDFVHKEIYLDWTGWKKHTVILKDMTVSGNIDWSKITNMTIKSGGDYTGKIYFDRIWLSDTNPGYVWADMSAENVFSTYKVLGKQDSAFEKNTEVGRMYPYSAKWIKSYPVSQLSIFYNNPAEPVDVTGYTNVSFAIYSNKNVAESGTPSRMWMYFYPMDGTGAWFQYHIDPNWQGWKWFSIPLSSFENKGTVPGTWTDIKGARIVSERWDEELELSFDSIVFTDEAPQNLALQSFSVENGAVDVPVDTRKITAYYNNALSDFMKEGMVTVKKNGEEITEGFIYGTYENGVEIYFNGFDTAARYEISVSGAVDVFDGEDTEISTVSFTTERSKEEKQFTEDINTKASSAADVSELINSYGYGEVFGITDEMEEHITSVIAEQKPYDSYDSIIDMSKTAVSVLSELNSCDSASLTEFLRKNSELVLYNTAQYQKYTEQTARKLYEINQALVQSENFKSFSEFRTKFIKTVDDYTKETQTDVSPGKAPSGGGGGGSSGSRVVITPPPVTEQKPIEAKPDTEEYFTDLSDCQWAKEAVNGLLENGVISKDPTKLFRPDDNVTRAEFVKLLTAALGIAEENAVCGFNDVPKDCWYYTFAASAAQKGIVLGDENNMFCGEAVITREDAAAMAYRAVSGKLSWDGQSRGFTDGEHISQYAKEAVYAMAQAGIINGTEDGSFEPKSYTKRAQAAKIIYEITQKMKGAVL